MTVLRPDFGNQKSEKKENKILGIAEVVTPNFKEKKVFKVNDIVNINLQLIKEKESKNLDFPILFSLENFYPDNQNKQEELENILSAYSWKVTETDELYVKVKFNGGIGVGPEEIQKYKDVTFRIKHAYLK